MAPHSAAPHSAAPHSAAPHSAILLRAALLSVLALVGAFVVGCGDPFPVPRTGPHLRGEPVVVPYPPPPAKVEIIDDPPAELAGRVVWVDGSWLWNSRRWAWQAGGWTEPVDGAYYARPTTVRRGDGTLVWFAGAWTYDPPATIAPEDVPR